MPVSTSPKEIKPGTRDAERTRHPSWTRSQVDFDYGVWPAGPVARRGHVEALGEAGAEHAVIWLTKFQEEDVIPELEGLAKEMPVI